MKKSILDVSMFETINLWTHIHYDPTSYFRSYVRVIDVI